ncbi:MAG: choice-of-anchor D domain-containing protein [Candidatus Aminicenantes bacterium]|nr:MAG: choice-of-anchor D domain-containing protein [Candidatus Aminicenantes bacterium]
MWVKKSKLLLIVVLGAFLLFGSCKDTVTISETYNKPVIWVSTFEMSFAASEFGSNPSNQILQIKNTGQGTLSYSLSDDANFYDSDWLSITPPDGTSSGGFAEHIVSIDKTGLEARENPYTAKVTISSNDAYNTPQTVDVSLTISEEQPPQINVSPRNLSFSARIGGPNPGSKTITIQNTGESTLNYQITSNAAWLSVNPPAGTSESGPNNHSVSVAIAGLSVGAYEGSLTITDPNASNNPQTVAVSLNISREPPPVIRVSTNQLTFSARVTGSNPSTQNFQVRNSGSGTLDYQITWDENWMSVDPDSGTSKGGNNTHRVSINKAGLGEGTYRGTITISDPNASNSPQTIDVTLRLTVQPPPATDNDVTLAINRTQGSPGTIVAVTIGVKGNLQPISAFGLNLTYNGAMFDFVDSDKGKLTGNWGLVSANSPSPGLVKVGGAAFGGTPIAVGSTGSIIIVRLRVTGGTLNDGDRSAIRISVFTDDINGMGVPSARWFTLNK